MTTNSKNGLQPALEKQKINAVGDEISALPKSSQSTEIYNQLFRYAEDLQNLIEQNERLNSHYKALLESSNHLLASQDELDKLISISNDIHVVTDIEGNILQANPVVKLIALPEKIIGTNIKDWIMPTHHEQLSVMMRCETTEQQLPIKEWELHLKSEQYSEKKMVVAAKLFPVKIDGGVRNLHWILRNIAAVKESEANLKINFSMANISNEGMIVTDAEGTIIGINPAFCEITGYSAKDVIGQKPSILKSGIQDKHFYEEMWNTLLEKGSWQGKIYNRKKNGELYPELLKITQTQDSNGRALSYVGTFSDMSQLQKAEDDLAFIAHHDSLTGLPNRLLLIDRLNQAIANGRRNNTSFTLIFIDLDRFKDVNDQFGHAVGDGVLQEVARRMSNTVREIDTIARLGGDEFILIVPGLIGEANIEQYCNKIILELIKPMNFNQQKISIGASLGCAEFPRHGEDLAQLMRNADIAMYRAKKTGGNKYFMASQEIIPIDAPLLINVGCGIR